MVNPHHLSDPPGAPDLPPGDAPPRAADRVAALQPTRFASLRTLTRRHGYILVAFTFTLGCLAWMVTYGTGRLLGREAFGQFYDGQARSLLAGRWDVAPSDIGYEAFIHNGKTYGYFGFAPALLRLPAAMLAPERAGRWSRLSCLTAAAVSLLSAYRLLLTARRAFGLDPGLDRASKDAYSLAIVLFGLGSTLIFILGRTYVFHEAIAWGSAFSLAAYDQIGRFLSRGRRRHLAAACGLAFLAFFSRATVGAGALAAVGLAAGCVAFSQRTVGRERLIPLLMAGGAIASAGAAFIAINHAKFGTTLEAAPLRMYLPAIAQPRRLERTGGRITSINNVRTTAGALLSPTRIRFTRSFPFVAFRWDAHIYPEAKQDIIEPYAGLPATAPGLTLLALIGMAAACRRRLAIALIPMSGAAIGAAAVLTANAITHRYLHDFFPLLVVCGASGLHALLSLPPRLRRAAAWAAVPLVVYGIWVNCGLALLYQRQIVWGVAANRAAEFQHWRQAIHAALSAMRALL